MKLREFLGELSGILSGDEQLMRLITYLPKTRSDSPLSEDKADIIGSNDYWDIVDDRMLWTPKADDLVDKDPKCRVLFYPNTRYPQNGNYTNSEQSINIDVFVHVDFDTMDMRLSWILDRINDLLQDRYIENIGTTKFDSGKPLGSPVGYTGYRVVYKFGDFQW